MADLKVLAVQVAAAALDLAAKAAEPAGPDSYARVEVPAGVDAACSVVKAVDSKRFTLGMAYPAFDPDVAIAADGFRDVASADLIEQAAWRYMGEHRQVGLYHFTPETAAGTVVESYIWRGPDWICTAVDGTEQIIVAGDWLLGTIWTPRAWDAITSGEVDGLSFRGKAARMPVSDATRAAVAARR